MCTVPLDSWRYPSQVAYVMSKTPRSTSVSPNEAPSGPSQLPEAVETCVALWYEGIHNRKCFPFVIREKHLGFGGTFFWTTNSVYQWSFCIFDCAFFLSCTWWFMSPYLLLVWIRSSAPRFNNSVLMGEITCFCFWDSLIIENPTSLGICTTLYITVATIHLVAAKYTVFSIGCRPFPLTVANEGL